MASQSTITSSVPGSSLEVTALLERVRAHLALGEPQKGLEAIRKARLQSPWVQNALGVCLLRLGDAEGAVNTFRGLVLEQGGLAVRNDAPTVFKANFATALLLNDNMVGCLSTLAEINGVDHPAANRLRDALSRWKASLSLWEKIQYYMGGQPSRRPEMQGPLGDIE